MLSFFLNVFAAVSGGDLELSIFNVNNILVVRYVTFVSQNSFILNLLLLQSIKKKEKKK